MMHCTLCLVPHSLDTDYSEMIVMFLWATSGHVHQWHMYGEHNCSVELAHGGDQRGIYRVDAYFVYIIFISKFYRFCLC